LQSRLKSLEVRKNTQMGVSNSVSQPSLFKQTRTSASTKTLDKKQSSTNEKPYTESAEFNISNG